MQVSRQPTAAWSTVAQVCGLGFQPLVSNGHTQCTLKGHLSQSAASNTETKDSRSSLPHLKAAHDLPKHSWSLRRRSPPVCTHRALRACCWGRTGHHAQLARCSPCLTPNRVSRPAGRELHPELLEDSCLARQSDPQPRPFLYLREGSTARETSSSRQARDSTHPAQAREGRSWSNTLQVHLKDPSGDTLGLMGRDTVGTPRVPGSCL